jgi:adenine-specific DNA-methyltransferase
MRPDVGTQAQFRKKKQPQTYRYDSSLSPVLNWDEQNPAREQGESQLALVQSQMAELRKKISTTEEWSEVSESISEAENAIKRLKALSGPFLNWAGKAERLSFDVPTLPLFIHERLSTRAIIETIEGHKADRQQEMFDLFGDPHHSITDQVLGAYEHSDKWVNRMVLGDSLVVMNSLLRYEFLGGQVQMIYIDPPYGVKFGSNFQPFVRRRDVKHNEDEDMTREPETVQAYRDTWELGLHSYLTYMRDRLLLARELLTPSGSIFVQISDENLHHVREVMDEVFGAENFVSIINFVKTSGLAAADNLPTATDYLLWYAQDRNRIKYRQLYVSREEKGEDIGPYSMLELPDGTKRPFTKGQREGREPIPEGAKRFRVGDLTKPGPGSRFAFEFESKTFEPGKRWWGTTPEGMKNLMLANRLAVVGNGLYYVRYWNDFPVQPIKNLWPDTGTGGFVEEKYYVVQTNSKVIQRCVLMTTDPGDLVLDPTCGSGTTAYVAEQWGRRWVTIDTSRVPLALARQRLLTATFPYYELKDERLGPAGGFAYKRKQNRKGEETGGIVPHVTLKSIANNEPPAEEVLVDRPEEKKNIVRVSGAFSVEATIPTPVDWDNDGQEDSGAAQEYDSFVERMLQTLRQSPVLRLDGNRTVTFHKVRPITRTLSLSAEAFVDATAPGQSPNLKDAVQEAAEHNKGLLPLSQKPVAFVFGPENGPVSENLVSNAAREANLKNYTHLYVIGFAIEPNARKLVENCAEVSGVPATYVQATPDLMMGDLLKNMRSSQIFSVAGLPEVKIHHLGKNGIKQYQVELLGLDVFDPITMEVNHRQGNDVPAWLLDTNHNNLVFHVNQAFFPRTNAWDNLKKSLKMDYGEGVWDFLAGTKSAPFSAGEHRQVAIKVIDDRGNELLVVKSLEESVR